MVTSFYPDGLGGTVDEIAVNGPLYSYFGSALYVHFGTGVDAAAPAGRDKLKPLKTLAQAVTNATQHSIIVLLDGHSETLTAPVTIPITKPGVVIVGCGQTAGIPNVSLRGNLPGTALNRDGALIAVDATSVELRNLKIEPHLQLNSSPRIFAVAAGFIMDGCHIECGANDQAAALTINADYCTIRDSTFISVATSLATRPLAGITIDAAVRLALKLEGLEVSDGPFGFVSGYGLDLSAATSMNSLKGEAVSLLLGASAKLPASTFGYIIPTVTGGGNVEQ